MQAVVLTGHGGPEMLEYRDDVPVPSPRAGEVLIAVRAAAVNNTDVNTRVGWYASSDGPDGAAWTGSAMQFPRIQGADACGAIVEVGAGVSEGRIGERVIVRSCLRSLRADGVDPWLGSEIDGAFAQFVRVPAAEAFRVESGLSDVELAAVPCSYGTAENLLERAGVGAGDRVLVTGASGGVGGAAVQLARRRGAEVVALAAEDKAAAVRALGAAEVLDRNADIGAELGHRSIDVVIDLVGGRRWPDLLRTLRRGGRYAASGAIGGPLVELDLRTFYLNDLTLLGCTRWADGVFEHLVGYLERREIVPTVAATFPLERIAEAQAAFEAKRHVGKIVLVMPAAG